MLNIYTKPNLSGNQTIINEVEDNATYKIGSLVLSPGYDCKLRIEGFEQPAYTIHNGLKRGDLVVPKLPNIDGKSVKIECVICGVDGVSFAIDDIGNATNSDVKNNKTSFTTKILLLMLFMILSWWIVKTIINKLREFGVAVKEPIKEKQHA